ncbi:MAG: iron ABC transporter permease [Hyphomicrobiaceae bacterium]|nr:iron ABC transporter permease [Hyphomicrobiaceae bacterium]
MRLSFRRDPLLYGLSQILGLCTIGALCLGPEGFDPILFTAAGEGTGGAAHLILTEVRFPRVFLAILLGSALGASGAVLQGLLRNPLADPGVVGVTASAGLGAVIAIGFGAGAGLAVPLASMLGAGLGLLLVFLIARGGLNGATLILAGIAVNALAAAATSLVVNVAPTPMMLSDMVLWLLGSLAGTDTQDLKMVVAPAVIGIVLLSFTLKGLRALALGREAATSLGLSETRLTVMALLGTALSVGALVSVTGAVGFVGLVVPHLMRPLVRHDPGRLVQVSAVAGSILVLAADTMLRVFIEGPALQLGVVTAFFGAPIFLIVALRGGRS